MGLQCMQCSNLSIKSVGCNPFYLFNKQGSTIKFTQAFKTFAMQEWEKNGFVTIFSQEILTNNKVRRVEKN